jgi:tRNA(fMet)-specific endonuclease VapC
VLDTSALIDLFRGSEKAEGFVDDESATTVITYYEIFQRLKYKKPRAEENFFKYFFTVVPVLVYDVFAAEISSDIMARLLSMGTPVNAFDVLIAGIAVANKADKLITRDNDFLKISKVADIDVLVY